jgi:hypothetical protein
MINVGLYRRQRVIVFCYVSLRNIPHILKYV